MRTNIQNLPLLAEYRGINNEIKEFNVEPPIYIKIMLIYLFILQ